MRFQKEIRFALNGMRWCSRRCSSMPSSKCFASRHRHTRCALVSEEYVLRMRNIQLFELNELRCVQKVATALPHIDRITFQTFCHSQSLTKNQDSSLISLKSIMFMDLHGHISTEQRRLGRPTESATNFHQSSA